MDSNLNLIKTLAKSLILEIDSLKDNNEIQIEEKNFNLGERVREFEIKMIKAALIKTAGNQRRAARLLGVKGTTLHYKIKHYDIKLKIAA